MVAAVIVVMKITVDSDDYLPHIAAIGTHPDAAGRRHRENRLTVFELKRVLGRRGRGLVPPFPQGGRAFQLRIGNVERSVKVSQRVGPTHHQGWNGVALAKLLLAGRSLPFDPYAVTTLVSDFRSYRPIGWMQIRFQSLRYRDTR